MTCFINELMKYSVILGSNLQHYIFCGFILLFLWVHIHRIHICYYWSFKLTKLPSFMKRDSKTGTMDIDLV